MKKQNKNGLVLEALRNEFKKDLRHYKEATTLWSIEASCEDADQVESLGMLRDKYKSKARILGSILYIGKADPKIYTSRIIHKVYKAAERSTKL